MWSFCAFSLNTPRIFRNHVTLLPNPVLRTLRTQLQTVSATMQLGGKTTRCKRVHLRAMQMHMHSSHKYSVPNLLAN